MLEKQGFILSFHVYHSRTSFLLWFAYCCPSCFWSLISIDVCPLHRQSFLYLSIWAITVGWMAKVLMQNVGNAENTELVNCNLPAWLRNVEVAANLLSHVLTSGEKSMTLGLVRLKGSPKYVNGRLPLSQLNFLARCCSLSSEVLIGTKIDFE